ncbi:MAG: hypothetical protein NT167_24125, partial [Verrucomicrobia bacterium]|nr:hypothetical protein [Verrucomicrobiota bacterium]
VKVRISNLGATDPCAAPSLSGATNFTLVEFEVTSECDYFIASLIENAQFLDSWGKVIGEGYFVVRGIKPRNRATGCATVLNLAREKLLTWRLEPGTVRPTVHIQPMEGSNVLAQVTVETW